MEHELKGSTALLLVVAFALSTPLSVIFNNIGFFTSSSAYVDGGDMYSHIAEAMHLKDLLKKGSTDLWYDKVTLGYPMFTAYHPLPTLLTALVMLILEGIMSSLTIFRVVLMITLVLIPVSWYLSGIQFQLSRLQSFYISILVFSCHSWRSFGLETSAIFEYGLYTQAFGMLIFPVAVSSIFSLIVKDQSPKKISTVAVTLILTFLSHFFFGMYLSLLTGITFVISLLLYKKGRDHIKGQLTLLIVIFMGALTIMLWWIGPCIISYKFVGGLPWRGESEDGYPLHVLISKFVSGEIFDYQRTFSWMTISVCNGIFFGFCTILFTIKKYNSVHRNLFFIIWLLASSIITVTLFLGRTMFGEIFNWIPFHQELEVIRYLSGCHFCGILFASYSFYIFHCHICDGLKPLIKYCTENISTILAILMSGVLMSLHFSSIANTLTVSEIPGDLQGSLLDMQRSLRNGRILAHKGFGTGGPWDLAFIPYLSGKPGLMTYSRGYHDSLSVFYVESEDFQSQRNASYASIFQLYNVHYLAISGVKVGRDFIANCQLKHLFTVRDLQVYLVLDQDSDYGYFEFVHVAGYINGDLKLIRDTVMQSLGTYESHAMFLLNPSNEVKGLRTSLAVATVVPGKRQATATAAIATWKIGNMNVDSKEMLRYVNGLFGNVWIYSQIIEEMTDVGAYHAVVNVSPRSDSKKLQNQEFLILKVTYHPFWRCYYYPVDDDFTLDDLDASRVATRLPLHHMAPNFMAVKLPPGRYYVLFVYKIPNVFKFLAVLSLLCFTLLVLHSVGVLPLRIFSERRPLKRLKSTAGIIARGTTPSSITKASENGNAWSVNGRYRRLSTVAQEHFAFAADVSDTVDKWNWELPVSSEGDASSSESLGLEEWLNDYRKRKEMATDSSKPPNRRVLVDDLEEETGTLGTNEKPSTVPDNLKTTNSQESSDQNCKAGQKTSLDVVHVDSENSSFENDNNDISDTERYPSNLVAANSKNKLLEPNEQFKNRWENKNGHAVSVENTYEHYFEDTMLDVGMTNTDSTVSCIDGSCDKNELSSAVTDSVELHCQLSSDCYRNGEDRVSLKSFSDESKAFPSKRSSRLSVISEGSVLDESSVAPDQFSNTSSLTSLDGQGGKGCRQRNESDIRGGFQPETTVWSRDAGTAREVTVPKKEDQTQILQDYEQHVDSKVRGNKAESASEVVLSESVEELQCLELESRNEITMNSTRTRGEQIVLTGSCTRTRSGSPDTVSSTESESERESRFRFLNQDFDGHGAFRRKKRWSLPVSPTRNEKQRFLAIELSGNTTALRRRFSSDDKYLRTTKEEGTYIKVPWTEICGTDFNDGKLVVIKDPLTLEGSDKESHGEEIVRVHSSAESVVCDDLEKTGSHSSMSSNVDSLPETPADFACRRCSDF